MMDLRALIFVLTWLAICYCQNSLCRDSVMLIKRTTTVIRLYGNFDCWLMNQNWEIERLKSGDYYYLNAWQKIVIFSKSNNRTKTIKALNEYRYGFIVTPIFNLNSCVGLNMKCNDYSCDDYEDYVDIYGPNIFDNNSTCGTEIRRRTENGPIIQLKKPKPYTIIQDTETTYSQRTVWVLLLILVAPMILAIVAIALCFMHKKFDLHRANRIIPLSDFVLESNFASIEENDQLQPDQHHGLPKYEELFSEHQEPPSYEEAIKDDVEIGDKDAELIVEDLMLSLLENVICRS